MTETSGSGDLEGILSKKDCEVKCKRTSIGGQALIEGIMMRGPEYSAMAVRNPEGEIVLEKWENKKPKNPKIRKIPIIRGVINFISSMVSGYKCLMRSAEISGLDELEDEMKREKEEKKARKAAEKAAKRGNELSADDAVTEEEKPEAKEKNKDGKKNKGASVTDLIMGVAMVLAFVLVLVLFIWLPNFVGTLILGENAATDHPIWLSVISGVLKVTILVLYMALVSLMKDIRRTFMYHGAEHKTIFCYENGLELTVENVKKQKRFHPRCGTSFLILMVLVGMVIMIIVSYILKTVLPAAIIGEKFIYLLIRCACTLVLMPLMMGIGYELIKLAGRHDNLLTRIISAPGVWLQHITVLEPTDDMIECAIKAFVEVIPENEGDK